MSKVISQFRKARSVELALAGASYDDIATEVGYANRGTAWKTVQKALKDREVNAVDEYRELELARLDALQASLWANAIAGDIKAVNACIKIIEQRTRLLGLDQKETREGNQTILVSPQSPQTREDDDAQLPLRRVS